MCEYVCVFVGVESVCVCMRVLECAIVITCSRLSVLILLHVITSHDHAWPEPWAREFTSRSCAHAPLGPMWHLKASGLRFVGLRVAAPVLEIRG